MLSRAARVTLAVTVTSLTLVLSVNLGVARDSAQPSSRPYPNMGNQVGLLPCGSFPGFGCAKYRKTEIPASTANAEVHAAFIKFLRDYDWFGGGHLTNRKPARENHSGPWPVHYVEVIDRPARLRYRDDPDLVKSVPLARITVAPNAVEDVVYGISNPTSRSKTFYLIGSAYKPDAVETTGDRLGDRWRISTWSLVEIQGTGTSERVVPVGRSGRVAWCKHNHGDASRDYGARFHSCEKERIVSMVKENRAAMKQLREFARQDKSLSTVARSGYDTDWIIATSKRLLNSPQLASPSVSSTTRALLEPMRNWDPFTDPVWITCGVGCCIAET